ncbi:MAG: hypothetical protein HFJ85_07950 [Oscillospiraceae bacterium]|nr:hypothetical protein [Oscillospiraceae bacterium]
MSTISSFGSFTTALLGVYAAQHGLNVTGNNISNINTPGYTRQTLDQVSLHMSGSERYEQRYNIKIGNGALVTGVSQIRDPYLDIRYRSETASVGAMDTKLDGLNAIAKILDEIGAGDDEHGIIGAQFSELLKTLQNLSDQTNQEEYDSQVRSAASALVSLFNSASKELQEVYNNTVTSFKQDLKTVNETLYSIRELNASIRKSEMHGDRALELRDERNRLIDKLSEYMKIDVTYGEEDIGTGMTVEKLTIRLANSNPDVNVNSDTSLLVDGIYATQIEMPDTLSRPNPDYDPTDPTSQEYLSVKNDNFTLCLTKLIDAKGYPWEEISKPKLTQMTLAEFNQAKLDLQNDPNFDGVDTIDDGNGNRVSYNFTTKNILDPAGNVIETRYYVSTTASKYSQPVELDDNDLYGSLQSSRELLTESGEFASADYIKNVDENAASKRGIPYYQRSLDLLANKIATVFNEANNGFMVNKDGYYIDGNDKVIELDGVPVSKHVSLTDAQKAELENLGYDSLSKYLEDQGGIRPEGAGNLFSNHGSSNDADGINASNISISIGWYNENVKIVASYVNPSELDEIGSTANENIIHLRNIMEAGFDYIPSDILDGASDVPLFTGSFSAMMNNIESVLGNDQRSTTVMLNTYYASAVDLDTSRDSVSGVDLNDEAVNLIQFQKAYTAACRLMTTLDEALERLISNTGIVGR